MHRFTQQAVMLFTLLTLPPAVLAGSTTYHIQNYPDLQNGWTLSGTITTDGTIGTIQPVDILSWTWTITQGTNSITNTGSENSGHIEMTNEITATKTQLTLEQNQFSSIFLIGVHSPYQDSISWFGNEQSTDYQYTASIEQAQQTFPLLPWNDVGLTGAALGDGLIATVSAAAVPEPASLFLVGFGAVCGSVYVMGHKRRERRTATTA